ncbi:hypothetical protein METHB2_900009 [Candidatus Methylobacter favarea]|uniref:Uncharacterized protein n=1 Tax=Candidatus Methylobacter favarea TaxID=2707345 RepID=A0A8S0Y765_9GAMM|nr:hypothetical protein METHB2_900009 [Candidatus Methylobacter favarea]
MHFLEGDFASIGDIEIARVENHEAHKREHDDAERIDPMEPAGTYIPHGIRFQLRHTASPWLRLILHSLLCSAQQVIIQVG